MLFRPSNNSRRDFLRRVGAPLVLPVMGGSASWLESAGSAFSESGSGGQTFSSPQPGALFRDVTKEAGINATLTCGSKEKNWILEVYGSGCVWFDYNNDGHLDLYVAGHIEFDLRHPPEPGQPTCTYRNKVMRACGPRGLKGAPDVLYHNNGDGTFTDVTAKAGVTDKNLSYGFSVLMEDLDGDGWPDIVVANDSGPNYFYRNKQDGTFEEVGEAAGIAYNGEGQEQANMGIAAGDYDNDGWTDLCITIYANDNKPLFHNDGKGIYTDVSYASGIGEPSIPLLGMATFFLDYNNSGLRDIFWVNGQLYPEVDRLFTDEHYHQNPQLFQNLGNGKFREVTKDVGLSAFQLGARGAACCDYDNDGNLDIAITNIDSPPVLLRNQGGASGHWLQVKTVGTVSNRDGIGAWVKVVAQDLTQYDRVRAETGFRATISACTLVWATGRKRIWWRSPSPAEKWTGLRMSAPTRRWSCAKARARSPRPTNPCGGRLPALGRVGGQSRRPGRAYRRSRPLWGIRWSRARVLLPPVGIAAGRASFSPSPKPRYTARIERSVPTASPPLA